ncbi:acyltransferase domain-containing protein, partial [Streptomyces actuosus]|uniref:acyltransferase domain-containing protein n=1 Tax=Streptomyces actuosus TaxID=1885 RepID=UPI0027DA6A9A
MLPLLDGVRVGIAAVNGPRAVVVSGVAEAVEEVAAHFRAQDRKVTALRVSHAFHSPLMEPMLADFRAVADSLTPAEPRIPVVSTLTGTPVGAEELTSATHWVEHVRRPVRFSDGLKCLEEQSVTRFVELGPDGTLTALAQSATDIDGRLLVPTLRKDRPETHSVLTAAAELFTRGTALDWSTLFSGTSADARSHDLPTYAFQRLRFWPAPSAMRTKDLRAVGLGSAEHPLLGAAVELAGGEGEVLLTGRLSLAAQEWLRGHVVSGVVVFPGAGFVELALRAGESAGCDRVEELTI